MPMPIRWMPILLIVVVVAVGACSKQDKPARTIPFADDFQRADLGEAWRGTGGQWRIQDGKLTSPTARNQALWLDASLPRDVIVEFDAVSRSSAVDLKCEIFGDGKNHASGYILILGGWNNSISAIARLDEHGQDRKAIKDSRHKPRTWYRWKIKRQGNKLEWFIDGKLYMTYDDPQPLADKGHDRFAFNNWESEVSFDNLVIGEP